MIETAERSTLVDHTADRLRQMIFTGQIKPGEMLPPRKVLASRFGVGIATIHEAVKSLDAVGLVESRPGKGTWVSTNTLASVINPSFIQNRFGAIDVAEVYEARFMLEVSLAELAAAKATPEEIERLNTWVERRRAGSSTTTRNSSAPTGSSIWLWPRRATTCCCRRFTTSRVLAPPRI